MRAVSLKRGRENAARRRMVATLPGWCAICGRPATDSHEVLTRARGGSIVDRSNVVRLCREDHEWITTHPVWAINHGWALSSWATEWDKRMAMALRHALSCPRTCRIDHRDGSTADDSDVVMEQGRGS